MAKQCAAWDSPAQNSFLASKLSRLLNYADTLGTCSLPAQDHLQVATPCKFKRESWFPLSSKHSYLVVEFKCSYQIRKDQPSSSTS